MAKNTQKLKFSAADLLNILIKCFQLTEQNAINIYKTHLKKMFSTIIRHLDWSIKCFMKSQIFLKSDIIWTAKREGMFCFAAIFFIVQLLCLYVKILLSFVNTAANFISDDHSLFRCNYELRVQMSQFQVHFWSMDFLI